MAQTMILIDHDESQSDMTRLILAKDGDRVAQGPKLLTAIRSFVSGFRKAKMVIGVIAAKATGTYTLASVVATDAVAINGTTFAAVASGATGNQFNVGADDTETAANLAASINASSDMSGIATATSAGAVVTVSAARPGTLGNAITITSADATITPSGARLTGGTNGADSRTYYFGNAT